MTEKDQKARLGRKSLLSLVDVIAKHRQKMAILEDDKVGKNSLGLPSSSNLPFGENGLKKNQERFRKGEEK